MTREEILRLRDLFGLPICLPLNSAADIDQTVQEPS